MIPSIGRSVHFVLPNGEHRPAIIVKIYGDKPTEQSIVNLQVFTDGPNDQLLNVVWKTSVPQDIESKKPNTWHEPERV